MPTHLEIALQKILGILNLIGNFYQNHKMNLEKGSDFRGG
jgi:hypothetical protein